MRSILVFSLINLVLLLSSISGTVVSIAFPNITVHYNASLVLAGWVLSIYQLVSACSMVLMGKVSDALGRKNAFLICSALFVVGSLFAAIAPSIQLLIAARFIQSIGAGGLYPAIIGMIVELFPQQRQKAIGISMSFFPIGAIIGPTIGSWLITSFEWQSIFWFNVPIVILSCLPLFFLLKPSQRKEVQIDYTGAGFFSAFLFAFMIGLSQIAHSKTSLDWLYTGLLFSTSIIFLILFIRHELKSKNPIIDLDLLRLKPFVASNIYNLIYGACVFGFSSLIPLYAVSVYNMNTYESGFAVMARAIGTAATSLLSGFLVVKWGYRKPMLLGSIIISGSILLLGLEFTQTKTLGVEITSVMLVSFFCFVMGLGMGIANTASNDACLDMMPHLSSTITGVRGMFRMSGAAVCIALATLILQFIGNMSHGFRVVFISIGLLVLLTIPFIFIIPEKKKRTTGDE